MRRVGSLLALVLAGCATTPTAGDQSAIYHYLRSNRDGSAPEHVVQFFPDPHRIEVYKWIEKCKTAAYVTAEFDPAAREAIALDAGKVATDGSQAKFGRIELNPATRAIDLTIETPDGSKTERAEQVGKPWALFDYDLADLNAAFQTSKPRGDFAFWWALVWPDPATGRMIVTPGWVDARHAGIVQMDGKKLRRFDLTLRSNPTVRGLLGLDPAHGFIVVAEFDRPNHDNYQDFALRLERIVRGGTLAWKRLLEGHYAGCPAS